MEATYEKLSIPEMNLWDADKDAIQLIWDKYKLTNVVRNLAFFIKANEKMRNEYSDKDYHWDPTNDEIWNFHDENFYSWNNVWKQYGLTGNKNRLLTIISSENSNYTGDTIYYDQEKKYLMIGGACIDGSIWYRSFIKNEYREPQLITSEIIEPRFYQNDGYCDPKTDVEDISQKILDQCEKGEIDLDYWDDFDGVVLSTLFDWDKVNMICAKALEHFLWRLIVS